MACFWSDIFLLSMLRVGTILFFFRRSYIDVNSSELTRNSVGADARQIIDKRVLSDVDTNAKLSKKPKVVRSNPRPSQTVKPEESTVAKSNSQMRSVSSKLLFRKAQSKDDSANRAEAGKIVPTAVDKNSTHVGNKQKWRASDAPFI